VILVLLTLYPFFFAIVASLRNWNLSQPNAQGFVGLQNYIQLLTEGRTWNALKNTALYTGGAVSVEFVIGFIIALLLELHFRGRNLIRTLFILPMIVTPAPIAMVWRQIFDPSTGFANYLLSALKIAPLRWAGDSSTALTTVIIVEVWQWTPFFILTLSAGLAAIPDEPIEAARIDGASLFQTIFRVIMPMLKPLIITVLIFRIMDAMKVYDLIYVLTEGGPGVSTETLNYYTYLTSFRWLRMGRGSALAVILLFVTIFVGSRLVNLMKGKE
jgi:multiple sugar transport system permease protein